jgi:hypothetical protein
MIRRQLFRAGNGCVREVFFIVHIVEVRGTNGAYSLTKERAARRLLGIARNDNSLVRKTTDVRFCHK